MCTFFKQYRPFLVFVLFFLRVYESGETLLTNRARMCKNKIKQQGCFSECFRVRFRVGGMLFLSETDWTFDFQTAVMCMNLKNAAIVT